MSIGYGPKCLPFYFHSFSTHINFKCFCTISPPTIQILLRNTNKPNSLEFSLVSALKSISSSSSLVSHGQQLHCLILKSGFNSNVFIQNSLISMYSKNGLLSCAKSIFDLSRKLDAASWNIMLAGYVRYGRLRDANEMFVKMPLRNCVSYTTMIMGLAQ
ncbi:UNVERIFIED_CONTAM: Pentatricopeptide repeat-containing protein, mitochondrial [Sesamum angustifolium]|uniref:Pentatricopeptide repeat-containing protein, mitochondrial n=1 Tax=Sesamum angustifolium TaxID=2727405 RepID=A0AAW2P0W6_9LAMI